MRRELLAALRTQPVLQAVEADFQHLLASWFSPAFLALKRVDWHSPAHLLEQIIQHEAVHQIRDWQDLRRRLAPDRRCFAFFHPALPDEPLIFVEVALTPQMPSAIAPLLDDAIDTDTSRARWAVFYSISNCQPGLRGVSLGNFLIKQVAEVIQREFPKVNRFCTLSPMPGFGRWLRKKQADKLAASLNKTTGKAVTLHQTVDETLIGGLIVKVGSKMIDTSIRSKLNALQNTMKEVG